MTDNLYLHIRACQSNCAQGRKACPCPEACELPEEEPVDWEWRVIFACAALAFAIVMALSVSVSP